MTASPTPTGAGPATSAKTAQVGLPSEETVARALCEARSQQIVSPDAWAAEMVHIREMEAKHPTYITGFSTGTDALRQARAILSLIRPAFDAKDQRIRELAALLDKQMGTPCEQIRHQQEIEAKERERKNLVAMAGGGLRSLAAVMKATFAGRGVDISDDEAERAARGATELIIYAAMAGNPREWCLSCGTVSGDGQCHCTEPFAAASCNRQARHYMSEMACEASASESRALSAEAELSGLRQAILDAAVICDDDEKAGDRLDRLARAIRARSASTRGQTE